MATRKLEIQILGDASQLSREFGRASKASSGFGGALGKLGKVAAVGVGAAFAGLAATLKVGFDELAEGQKVSAQTGAALKSTGGAANVTAKEIEGLAGSLSRMSGVDDEAIQSGENLLLTFTNIRNEVGKGNDIFNQATTSILDMSVALGQDMKSSAIQLGKALNDPIKGVTALQRVGVSFTAAQKEQIKSLVESGNAMGAQKLILAELTKEFGGSAKAAGETLPGQLSKLKNSFQEVAGRIASRFAPLATKGLELVGSGLDIVGEKLSGFLKQFDKAKGLQAKLSVVWENIEKTAQELADKIGDALGAVDWEKTGRAIVDGIGAAIEKSAKLAKQLADKVMDTIRAIDWVEVGKVAGPGLASAVATAFATLLDPAFWLRNWELALAIGLTVFGGVIGRVAGAIAGKLLGTLTGALARVSPTLGAAFGRLMADAGEAAARALGFVGEKLASFVGRIFGRLAKLATFVLKVLGITAAIDAITDFAGRAWEKIKELAGRFFEAAKGAGKAIVDGIRDGISGAWEGLKSWVLGQASSLVSSLKDALTFWSSTPDVWAREEIGIPIIDGIIQRLNAKDFRPAIRAKIDEAIAAARDAISARQGALASAFDGLVNAALAAFDRLSSELETRSERKLRVMDERAAARQRKEDVAAARRGLAEAQAAFAAIQPQEGEDPSDFAQRILDGTNAIVAAQKTLDDALAAQKRAYLEAQAEQERKALDDRRALQRRHLEEQLGAAANAYERGAISLEQYNQRVLAILKRFNVPMKNAALALGGALAEGLREAFEDVQKAAKALAQEVITQFSKIRIIINVDLSVKNVKPPGLQHGGPVRAGGAYVVGEAGPELFIPRRSGRILPSVSAAGAGGGGVVVTQHFHIAGSVIAERELLEIVQRQAGSWQRRNGGSFFA